MNREILFRGKRVDNGEWVEGNLTINEAAKAHRIVVGFGLTGDMEGECHVCFGEFHLVDPSTIGQFTGLTDRKGNKVFEGDVESSGGVVRLGIYEMFSDRSGFPTWIAERKNGASFVLVCDNEFKIRETIVGTIHDTHLTKQS